MRATRTIEAGGLTETQRRALRFLAQAYDRDVPVAIEERTDWKERDDGPKVTVSRAIANRLQFAGFARITPAGWFLLLTPKGKAEVGITT